MTDREVEALKTYRNLIIKSAKRVVPIPDTLTVFGVPVLKTGWKRAKDRKKAIDNGVLGFFKHYDRGTVTDIVTYTREQLRVHNMGAWKSYFNLSTIGHSCRRLGKAGILEKVVWGKRGRVIKAYWMKGPKFATEPEREWVFS